MAVSHRFSELMGRTCTGVNTLNLWLDMQQKGYASPMWGTLRQWNEQGSITADLNDVYFVRPIDQRPGAIQIRSRPEAGKKDIGGVRTGWVEDDMLYPLIKGAGDFDSFYLNLDAPNASRLLTFVPNTAINGDDYDAADMAMNDPSLRQTRAWFTHYKTLLEARSTYRRQMKDAPFFAIYNVGPYTFAPWKVIWPEMSSHFFAAVAGSAPIPTGHVRPYVPDHKIYFASFEDPEPAYYLCSLLNAPMVREWIEAHIVNIQVGDVFKHMNLPAFDRTDAQHMLLAALSEQAHQTHDKDARDAVVAQIAPVSESVILGWLNR